MSSILNHKTVKVVVFPLLVACLIPVVYRASVSYLSSSEGFPVKALSEWSTRVARLEQETATYGDRVRDLATSLQSVEDRLGEMEGFAESVEQDRIKTKDEKENLVTKSKYDIDDTGWKVLAIAFGSLQLVITILIIVLFVKVKRLTIVKEQQSASPADPIETNCINEELPDS